MTTLSRRSPIAAASALGVVVAAGRSSWVVGAQATPEGEARTDRVDAEGDELVFDVRGRGAPLLLIPGGASDATAYALVAPLLAGDYTVITYDPRGYGRSTRRDPQNYEVGQQGRDAVAVIAAAGFDAALVFGSSGGAIIGLEMARSQPRAVAELVAHEPPAIRVLPDAAEIQRGMAGVYLRAWTEGPESAFLHFLKLAELPVIEGRPITDAEIAQILQDVGAQEWLRSAESFVKYEMLPVSNYKPDVAMIKEHGVKVVLGVGERSLDKIYGRAAPLLAEQLGGPLVTFPGDHVSYLDPAQVDAWVAALRPALDRI
jgi:pimeloyl-ACP methyl ester carboxylesterase